MIHIRPHLWVYIEAGATLIVALPLMLFLMRYVDCTFFTLITKSACVTMETINVVKRDAISAFNHTIPTTFFYNAHEKP